MRMALGVEYDGASYFGWQRQREMPSVQETLEKALSKIADQNILVQCAGRTDTGVHGTGQVVHFDAVKERPLRAWTLGVNTLLPKDISVSWAHSVPDSFHARFSATARRYRYIIYNSAFRSGILGRGLSHYHAPLDEKKMHEAGQYLLGEHDFTSFRASQCQSKTARRNIHHLNVSRLGAFIIIDIQANAFLHHMVRNITGSLLLVGKHEKNPEWIKNLLEVKDRQQAATTAKAEGLYLVKVHYPEHFGLPISPIGPLFLPD